MLNTPLVVAFKYILDFYFGNVKLENIFALLPNGAEIDTSELLAISKDFGLSIRSSRLSIDKLQTHDLPAIAIYKGDVLVVTNISDTSATVFDPTNGTHKELPIDDAKEEREILFFQKYEEEEAPIFEKKDIDREWFWRYFRGDKGTLVSISMITLFINIFVLAIPLYVLNVYDRVIPNHATETLITLTVGFLIVIIFDLALKSIRVLEIEKLRKKIILALEGDMMQRVLQIRSDSDGMMMGQKSNLFRELGQIGEFFASKTILHILDLPFFIFMLFVAWLISPIIAFLMFLGAILIFAQSFAIYKLLEKKTGAHFAKIQNKQNFLLESIRGAETLKLTNGISRRLFDFRRVLSGLEEAVLRLHFTQNLSSNISNFILQLVTVAIVAVGVFEIYDQKLSLGGLIALMILSSRTMVPIVHLSTIFIKTKEFLGNLDAIGEYRKKAIESEEGQRLGIAKLRGIIEFENVSYSFAQGVKPALSDINIKINPGEKVGIIGKSGAGKSTFLKLICGLYLPSSGSLRIDGHTIDTIHPVELRESIGASLQEPFMFAASIVDNIELGSKIGKAKTIDILRSVGAEELLALSKEAENMNVGESGSRLSVGQKHLLSLARSFAREPNIVLLDEPTGNMDPALEMKVVKRLEGELRNKTAIIVTHRLPPLGLCDRLIVFEGGRVVMDGKKEQVLALLKNTGGA